MINFQIPKIPGIFQMLRIYEQIFTFIEFLYLFKHRPQNYTYTPLSKMFKMYEYKNFIYVKHLTFLNL